MVPTAKLFLHNNLEMKTDSTPIRQNGERSTGVNDSSLPTKSRFITGLSNLRVEWSDENDRATGMGGLAYFVEYLQATGLFESFVRECPLSYESNNAPAKLDIL